MSTKPDLPCTSASIQAAKEHQVRARAEVVQLLPPAARARMVDAFLADDADVGRRTQEPWQALQRQEAYEVDAVAQAALQILFGTRAGFTPRQASDLEQASTYLVRRIQPAFMQHAHAWATETLLSHVEFKVAVGHRPIIEQRIIASRIVEMVRASVHAVLEAHTPIQPGIYLRAAQTRGGK
jgi:hypothetical protein